MPHAVAQGGKSGAHHVDGAQGSVATHSKVVSGLGLSLHNESSVAGVIDPASSLTIHVTLRETSDAGSPHFSGHGGKLDILHMYVRLATQSAVATQLSVVSGFAPVQLASFGAGFPSDPTQCTCRVNTLAAAPHVVGHAAESGAVQL